MKIVTEKFALFDKRHSEAPMWQQLKIDEKINLFFEGIVPELSIEECKKIKSFLPMSTQEEMRGLTKLVMDEIDLNVVNVTKKKQLRLYLNYLSEKLTPIAFSLGKISLIERVQSVGTDLENNLTTPLLDNQKRAYWLLHDFIRYDTAFYYRLYSRVERHVLGIQFLNGLLNPEQIKTVKKNTNSNLLPFQIDVKHLSAFEIALRHWFLETAKKEDILTGKQIVEKYSKKKVEVFINQLRKNGLIYDRKGLLGNLKNVQNSLSEFSEIQRSITNHINKIN